RSDENRDGKRGALKVGALIFDLANDGEGSVGGEERDIRRPALYQQHVTEAKLHLTNLAANGFALPVDGKHLQTVTLAEAEALERAPQQRRTGQQKYFDQMHLVAGKLRIAQLDVGFDVDAGDILDFQDLVARPFDQQDVAFF